MIARALSKWRLTLNFHFEVKILPTILYNGYAWWIVKRREGNNKKDNSTKKLAEIYGDPKKLVNWKRQRYLASYALPH
jgi:hypothetical protein